jgi:hypothetical protein
LYAAQLFLRRWMSCFPFIFLKRKVITVLETGWCKTARAWSLSLLINLFYVAQLFLRRWCRVSPSFSWSAKFHYSSWNRADVRRLEREAGQSVPSSAEEKEIGHFNTTNYNVYVFVAW